MATLARWCYRHRLIVVALWVAVAAVLVGLAGSAGSTYRSNFRLPETESSRALNLLQSEFPAAAGGSDRIVVHVDTGTVFGPAVRSRVEPMLGRVAATPGVREVLSFYRPEGAWEVSRDQRTAFATMNFARVQVSSSLARQVIDEAQAAKAPGLDIELGGAGVANAQRPKANVSEGLGFIAAAVVLVVAFGSLLAMLLPLVSAAFALLTGLSIVALITHVMAVADFAPQLASLIGLGVGVDYALFLVSRHRANLRRGLSVEASVVNAVSTAGRAVLFAGAIVCISLLGMFAVGVSFLYGVAVSAAAVVAVTMLASLTLLPALLGLLGMHVLSRRTRARLAEHGPEGEQLSIRWWRWGRLVERRPALLAALAGALMVVLALPLVSMRLGATDQGNDPPSTTTRRAYDLLAAAFGPGFNGPLQLAVHFPHGPDPRVLTRLSASIGPDPDVAEVTPARISPSGRAAVVVVYPRTSPQDAATNDLLDRLRDTIVPRAVAGTGTTVYVGGVTASYADFSTVLSDKLPVFVGSVVAVAFLLLLVVFRSLLVPLTASVMNLLAAGASFGVLVAVFQWGWAGDVVGIGKTGPIDAFAPVLMFAILFGLSMDYEVFLVSRIHEEWTRRRDNRLSVTLGQAETGQVITAAAAIMVLVFASFVFGGQRIIKLFGIGLAAAVFLDAVVVRTVLVPALMHLAGRWNWWLPRALDRLLPAVSVEGVGGEVGAPTPAKEPAEMVGSARQ